MKVPTFKSSDKFTSKKILTPLNEAQKQEYRRRLLWHGFFLFIIGCITITFFPLYTK
jgi:hypothetical protein